MLLTGYDPYLSNWTLKRLNMFLYYLETFWIFSKIPAFGLDESVFLMDPVITKYVQLPVTIGKIVDTCDTTPPPQHTHKKKTCDVIDLPVFLGHEEEGMKRGT